MTSTSIQSFCQLLCFLLCSSSLWRGRVLKHVQKDRKQTVVEQISSPSRSLIAIAVASDWRMRTKKRLGTFNARGFTMIYSCAWSCVKFRARFRLLQQFELVSGSSMSSQSKYPSSSWLSSSEYVKQEDIATTRKRSWEQSHGWAACNGHQLSCCTLFPKSFLNAMESLLVC